MTRILIVYDNESDRSILHNLLQDHGYQVEDAINGKEAFDKAQFLPPDLIISDLLMPVMDGYTLLRHWKADPILKSIGFIIYTATYTLSKEKQLALDLGADAFLVKTDKLEIFLVQIKETLANQKYNKVKSSHKIITNTYNEILIHKLEEKMDQLTQVNQVLQLNIAIHKEDEEKYQQLADRLSLATSSAGIGIWTWDIIDNLSVWDKQMHLLYGLKEGEFGGNYEAWLRCIKTEEVDKNKLLIQSALKNEQEYTAEFPILWPDNSIHYIAASAKVIRNEDAQPVRMVGINYDITPYKEAEYELRLAKDNAEKTSTELASYLDAIGQLALVSVFDLPGCFIEVNQKQCNISGYSEHEMIGQDNQLLNSGIHPEEFFTEIKETVANGDIWHGEVCERSKQGDHYWVDSIIAPLRDQSRKISRCISVKIDITERKQKEMELRERLKETSCLYAIRHDMLIPLSADNFFNRVIEHIIPAMQFPEITAVIIQVNEQKFTSKNYKNDLTQGLHANIVVDHKLCGYLHVLYSSNKPFLEPEEPDLINAIANDLQLWLERKQIEKVRKEGEALIWQQANFDALTNLPNRRMFKNRLELEIKASRRTGLPFALMVFDLDHFKQVNDTYGHGSGDILLRDAANRLKSCIREIDLVARLGGDEFIIIVAGLDNSKIVERIAYQILQRLLEPFHMGNEVAYISTSIGIALYPDNGDDTDTLLGNADQAMYASKNRGRNCFSYFTTSMQQSAQARWRLTDDLHHALPGNQLQLYYQPIVELETGAIHKAEALIRWHHPTQGMIGPVDFISIAEDSGIIIDIGDWVLRQAANQAKKWRVDYHPDFQISINVSPIQFHNQNHDLESCFDYLKQQALPGQGIAVEITEGLLLNNNKNVSKQLDMLRNAGVQTSIDDFGTGYSALSYLRKFNIDYLKIDRSFILNLTNDSDNMVLTEAIIVMAHKLGIKVIAEGVETEQQKSLLIAAGCDYGQGYLFSRPLPPEDIEEILG